MCYVLRPVHVCAVLQCISWTTPAAWHDCYNELHADVFRLRRSVWHNMPLLAGRAKVWRRGSAARYWIACAWGSHKTGSMEVRPRPLSLSAVPISQFRSNLAIPRRPVCKTSAAPPSRLGRGRVRGSLERWRRHTSAAAMRARPLFTCGCRRGTLNCSSEKTSPTGFGGIRMTSPEASVCLWDDIYDPFQYVFVCGPKLYGPLAPAAAPTTHVMVLGVLLPQLVCAANHRAAGAALPA